MNAKEVHVEVEAGDREREFLGKKLAYARPLGQAALALGLHERGKISAILPVTVLPEDIKNIAYTCLGIDEDAAEVKLTELMVAFLLSDVNNYVIITEHNMPPEGFDSHDYGIKYRAVGSTAYLILGHDDGLDANEVRETFRFTKNGVCELCYFANLPNGYEEIPDDQWCQTILRNTQIIACGAYDMDSFIILRL